MIFIPGVAPSSTTHDRAPAVATPTKPYAPVRSAVEIRLVDVDGHFGRGLVGGEWLLTGLGAGGSERHERSARRDHRSCSGNECSSGVHGQ